MLTCRTSHYLFYNLILGILSTLIFFSPQAYANKLKESPLILAVHPYLGAQELKKRFTPLAKYLSKEIGHKVIVRVGRTYEEHLQAICHNEVDIAFIGPAPYVKLSARSQPKHLLAKLSLNNQAGYYGHIVTRKDSSIQLLSDLKDKSFAFGDPHSTMSHIIPLFMLQQEAILKDDLSYSQFLFSHRNVAHAVLAGDFDAGAIKHEIYEEFLPKGLREIAITPLIPPHLFIANNNIPDKLLTAIKKAMLKIHTNADGLNSLKFIHHQLIALVPVQNSDYDQLRDMINQISAE